MRDVFNQKKMCDHATTEIDKFCCNPSSVQVSPETANYYRRICDARKAAKDQWDSLLDQFGSAIVSLPIDFVLGIFSPEGLEMIGLTLGIELGSKIALNAMLRSIAAGVGKEVLESASILAAKEGALWVNNMILTTVLTNAVKEGSLAALSFRLTNILSKTLGRLNGILAVVQLLSMVLDSWDPYGYGQELNAAAMKELEKQFNQAFRSAFVNQVAIGQDELGRPVYPTDWPIIFTVPTESDGDKLWDYVVDYLSSLEYNSDGYKIEKPPGGNLVFPVWNKLAQDLFSVWNGGNTMATRAMLKNGRYLVGWLAVAFFALFLLETTH